MISSNPAVALIFPSLLMLVSLPGLVLWRGNAAIAKATLIAAKARGIDNGRLQWATYSGHATRTHALIEGVFVAAGLLWTTLAAAGLAPLDRNRLVVGPLLVACSALLTVLAYKWRQIDDDLVEAAARRNAEREELILRAAAQDVRGEGRDARGLEQDARSIAQDDTASAQDARQIEQDHWDGV